MSSAYMDQWKIKGWIGKKKQVHQMSPQNIEMLKKSASIMVFCFVLRFAWEEWYEMFVAGYVTATSCLNVYYISASSVHKG